MLTLHLIRHGHNRSLSEGRLAGRAPGYHLDEKGRGQAAALRERIRDVPLDLILASPLERCRETAEMIVEGRGLVVEVSEELLELDFGAWTGRTLAELEGEALWKRFNAFREGTSIPGGESLLDAQTRIVRLALELRERRPEGHVALVGHGDPLRALLLHFLGMPLGHALRIELEPCSWSTLELDEWSARLTRLGG